MTQTEYEFQDTTGWPKRSAIGSVVIERYHMWTHQTTDYEGRPVEIRLYDLLLWDSHWGPYRTNPKYPDTLYTMDEHGNCKSASVFREPLKEIA